MSQSSCILVSNRKHRRSVFGTDRTGAGIMLSKRPSRGGRNALGAEEVAVGGGTTGTGPVRCFFAFSVSSGRPGGMDSSLRISGTDSRIRTLGVLPMNVYESPEESEVTDERSEPAAERQAL